MVWREKRTVEHGTRWKYAVATLFVIVFLVLIELLIITAPLDPVIPVLVIIAIIGLIPVAVFVVDIYFCADFS